MTPTELSTTNSANPTLAGAANLDGTVWLIEIDPQTMTARAFRTASEAVNKAGVPVALIAEMLL